MPVTAKEIELLNTEEKMELVQKLWQSIEAERSQPLTNEQQALLDKRLQQHKSNPTSGKPWSEIKNKYSR